MSPTSSPRSMPATAPKPSCSPDVADSDKLTDAPWLMKRGPPRTGVGLPAMRSTFVERRDCRSVLQPNGLVFDSRLELAQPRLVLPRVVGAEQQLRTGDQRHPHVGLGAATVAPVAGGKRTGGQCGGHGTFSLLLDVRRSASTYVFPVQS